MACLSDNGTFKSPAAPPSTPQSPLPVRRAGFASTTNPPKSAAAGSFATALVAAIRLVSPTWRVSPSTPAGSPTKLAPMKPSRWSHLGTNAQTASSTTWGGVALAMMEKYDEHTSHLPDESYRRMEALFCMATTRQNKCGDEDGALQIYKRLLHILRSIKEKNGRLNIRFMAMKTQILMKSALVYKSNALDKVCFRKAYLQKAHDCAVEARDICSNLSDPDSLEVMQSEVLLDAIKGLMAGRRSSTLSSKLSQKDKRENENALSKATQTHTLTVQQFGEESSVSLSGALSLAGVLVENGNTSEAFSLLSDALVTAKRVFGPSHEITLQIEDAHETVSADAIKQSLHLDSAPSPVSVSTGPTVEATVVGVPSKQELNMTDVEVLRKTKDNKYIVRIPTGSKFKAMEANLIFDLGTPVVLRGLTQERHLNGKEGIIQSYDENLKQYTVAVGESFRRPVAPDHVEVTFP